MLNTHQKNYTPRTHRYISLLRDEFLTGHAKGSGEGLDLTSEGANTCFLLAQRLEELGEFFAGSCGGLHVYGKENSIIENLSNLHKIGFNASPTGHCWGPDPNTPGSQCALVPVERISVKREPDGVADFLEFVSGQAVRAQVPKE